MIKTKQDLKDYLKEDSRNYFLQHMSWWKRIKTHLYDTPISDQAKVWNYIYVLRHLEYYTNNSTRKGKFHRFAQIYYAYRLRKLSRITGFQIPPNTCEKGLTIWHWGTIIINPNVRLGMNCTLHPMVIIGHKQPGGACPQIGNNVVISGGSRIIGDISIGNNVVIAPNACVTKNVPNDCVVGGIPASIIKNCI